MAFTNTARVAFLYHFFPHYRKGVISELSQKLNATFVGDSEGAEGIEPHLFDNAEIFYPAKSIYFWKFAFQPRLIWYCLTANDDAFVFLANPNHLSTWIGALIVRARKKRVIFWGHGFKSDKASIKNSIRATFFRLSDGFFVYGWRAKRNAIALGFEPKSIYVGFNSLDYEVQYPIREKLLAGSEPEGSSKDAIQIFCISRLTRLCRYDMLLKAASLLRSEGIRCEIKIVGDGPERQPLEVLAAALGLNVTFFGAIYDDFQIASLIYEADLTVSPGKVGLTAMHSLMFGTPVVSHNNFFTQMPEVEAIVPGFTGDLFEDGSVEDLARTIRAFPERFKCRSLARARCFAMIDSLYNPKKQVDVMLQAVSGVAAEPGDDARMLFNEDSA